MIVFHEGLPGSGKSYEALVMHIVPAVSEGRDILTNINGINYEKIAELSGIPEKLVRQILVTISHSDVDDEEQRLELVKQDILAKTKKDSLVVLDEIQDLHPTGRQKLPAEWSKYIASHRHEGLDIVLMGQDRRDVHPIWRRRIQRVITFNKLTAVGADASYRWECWEATRPEKFKRVSSGVRKYDKKYFGAYASHTAGTENKDTYTDKRANVLNNRALRLGAIALIVVPILAINHLRAFFNPEDTNDVSTVEVSNSDAVASGVGAGPVAPSVPQSQAVGPAEPTADAEPPPLDMFDDQARRNRLRLTGVVTFDDGRVYARVDVVNGSGHRLDEYDIPALEDLGWSVSYRPSGLHITKADREHLARPWPLDTVRGRVDRTTNESLSARY